MKFKFYSLSGLVFLITLISPVAIAAPINSELPIIQGELAVGSTLTANNGNWTGTSNYYTYQWSRCDSALSGCVLITGANSSNYKLAAAEAGKFIKVAVTAIDGTGGSTVFSKVTSVVLTKPSAVIAPQLSGSLSIGSVITSTSGSWTSPNSGIYIYRWLRCDSTAENSCSYASNTSASTYVVTNGDIGKFIRSEVTTQDGTKTLSASAKSATIGPLNSEPRNLVPPTISGTTVIGEILKAETGQWISYPLATFTKQWQRCTNSSPSSCQNISGQIGDSYTVLQNDLNSYFRVLVTGINNIAGSIVYSTVVGPIAVATAPVSQIAPSISGNFQEGQTLQISNGTWLSNLSPTFVYSWFRCTNEISCQLVPGATTNSFLLTYLDGGYFIKGQVKASNSAGSNLAAAISTKIAGSIANFLLPEISGSAKVGSTITTNSGDWSLPNVITFSYKWQKCISKSVSACADIPDALSSKYKIASNDKNYYLRSGVSITGKSSYYFSQFSPKVEMSPSKGKSCEIVGQKSKIGNRILVCKKTGSKKIWQ